MANQNLSQFGEKLFVADADHTFIWDSAASISKRVSRNSWLNSGTLTSDAPVTISQTWNQIGTAFTALKINAVSTASASGSLLLDLQVGGVSQFSVQKNGSINANSTFNLNGTLVQSSGNVIPANALILNYFNQDVVLLRDASNTLALRNSTSAQTFNVYGTYTSGTVYERMFMRYSQSALAFQVGTEHLGATSRPLQFSVAGTTRMTLEALGGSNTVNIYGIANSSINILALRNTSGTPLFQCNLNASGNAGFFVGSNALISDAGSSYFNGGNVGIGTTAPTQKLNVIGTSQFQSLAYFTQASPLTTLIIDSSTSSHKIYTDGNTDLCLQTSGASRNVGIGTTSPTSKLHVAGNSSPTITVDNTLATGASQLLFKNTVVTGDTDGIFLNGSAQSGFGGNGSLNIKATTGPLAFHTNTVTNALSIAQNGVATFAISIAVNSAVRTSFINNIGDSLSMFNFVNDSTGTSTYAVGGSAPLMRFGGTTTSFPAIKRSATTLQIRLANDSDFAPIQGKLTTETAFTATTVVPTGFITLYDSTGTAYKVPCVQA